MAKKFEGFKVNQKVRLNQLPIEYRGDEFVERMFSEGVIGEVVAYDPDYREWRVEFLEGGYGNFRASELTEVDERLAAALAIDTPPVAEIVHEVFPGTEAKDDADEYDRVRVQWGLADRENIALRAERNELLSEMERLKRLLTETDGLLKTAQSIGQGLSEENSELKQQIKRLQTRYTEPLE